MTAAYVLARLRLWLGAGVLVMVAWLLGFSMWDTGAAQAPPDAGFREASFSIGWNVLSVLLVGLPVATVAGIVRARSREFAGTVAVMIPTLVLAGSANLSSFGGICLDAGDACIVGTATRAIGLLVPLACLAIGCGVELLVHARDAA